MARQLLRRWTRRYQPLVDRVTSDPRVRRWLPSLASPSLWHLNRRSTARAVAVGLFCGLIPGPLQMAAALALTLVVRANLPLALITTLYTNPFTIVPLYLAAYELGRRVVPGAGPARPFVPPADGGFAAMFPAMGAWMVELGVPLAVGLLLLAATLSAAGWIAVRVAWRVHVVRAWRRRARLHGHAVRGAT